MSSISGEKECVPPCVKIRLLYTDSRTWEKTNFLQVLEGQVNGSGENVRPKTSGEATGHHPFRDGRPWRQLMKVPIFSDETLDRLLSRTLKIIQKRKGYRFSIDAIVLAHFCRLRKGDQVIDLGTGHAVVPLLLARSGLASRIVGVEIQTTLVDMARRNIAINNMEKKITLIHRDVRDLAGCLEEASFDVAITNPPYCPVQAGRLNPDPQKAVARHEIHGSLQDMVRAAARLLRPKGRFYLVYPASRTVDMLLTLRESHLEPKRMQVVHSRSEDRAKLILAEAIKGGRSELIVVSPLFVYDQAGGYTKDMKEIYTTFQKRRT
jgi:tRNA1Val (adenine37-N6)-methyltransferase